MLPENVDDLRQTTHVQHAAREHQWLAGTVQLARQSSHWQRAAPMP